MIVPSNTKSWWQYSTWMKNIARNMRITEPTGTDLSFIRTWLKITWNPVTQTGLRPWLDTKFKALSVNSTYQCDIDHEPTHVLVKMLEVVGRDYKKIPLSDYEVLGSAIMILYTGNRRYGTGPYYGGVSGSQIVIV